MEPCTRCEREVPGHDGVNLSSEEGGSLGFFCGRCYAEFLSEKWGEPVEHLEVDQVTIADVAGRQREFHFRYNPVPRGLRAFEMKAGVPAGWEFALMAEEDEPAPALVGRLLDKIRRSLAHQHLEPCDITSGGLAVKGMTVRGQVQCELDKSEGPVRVVVDGRSLPWEQLGAMLASFEGFQFRLEIKDLADEF